MCCVKYGCTDVNAENYNASADTDNDSYVYDCFTAGSDMILNCDRDKDVG